jgi:hypothetical protein
MSVVIDGNVGSTSPIGNLNNQTISTNYTVPASTNLVSAGPVTVGTGYVITVSTGSRWVVV